MSDYIKRSDLAAIISDLLVSPWAARRMSNAALGVREALCLVQDIVNDEVQNEALKLPAADVRPVVRGKWVPKNTDGSWRVDTCSACKKDTHYVRYAPAYNYCPNCGADMREDEE